MSLQQQPRAEPSSSRTMTITPAPAEEGSAEAGPSHRSRSPPAAGVLKLRGGPLRKQRVVWSEEVVDNEGMGKKKSKICCIYHKPRAFDESSSESECSSDDDHDHGHGRGKGEAKGKGKDVGGKGKGQSHQTRRLGGGNVREVDTTESDSSEGGAGDGRARPARKSRRRPKHAPKGHHDHHHHHDDCPDKQNDAGSSSGGGHAAPNKYDVQR